MTWELLRRGMVLAAIAAAMAACATPESIRTKSKASAELYTDILAAHGTFSRALEQELRRRDRLELETAVRLGQRALVTGAPLDKLANDVADAQVQIRRQLKARGYARVGAKLAILVIDLGMLVAKAA